MYLSRSRTESSFPEIGEAFWRKGSHHSHACCKEDRKRKTKGCGYKIEHRGDRTKIRSNGMIVDNLWISVN